MRDPERARCVTRASGRDAVPPRILPPSGGFRFLAIAGQSNALGSHFDAAPSGPLGPHLVIDHDSDLRPITVEAHGPEVGVVMALATATVGVAIAKRAISGSTIAEWASTYLAQLSTASGRLYQTPTDVLWVHGESAATDEARSLSYQTDLEAVIATYRATHGAGVRWWIAELQPTLNTAEYPYVANVRAAQVALVAADPLAFLLDTDGLTKRADDIHYDGPGQVDLGERWVAALDAGGYL